MPESGRDCLMCAKLTVLYVTDLAVTVLYVPSYVCQIGTWAKAAETTDSSTFELIPRREKLSRFHRGTSLINKKRPRLGPYSRTIPRALRWPQGGGGFL